ncbi:MraY family glycosyltransferase [Plantibacter sp. Mn2098]|uniref:MraY family glycosyltransferase n=1 Tax=Plantibacter sp. Mn2098 TaxID=3395266 RepID=UPI003BD78185
MTSAVWLVGAIAFLVSLCSQFVIRPILIHRAVVDTPNHRSMHVTPTIRGGGIGVTIAVAIGLGLTAVLFDEGPLWAVAAIAVLNAAVGFIEDVRGLPVKVRFLFQVVIGLGATTAMVIAMGATPWWIPLGIVALVAYTNIANFMDGINGISSMHGVVVGGFYTILGFAFDLPGVAAAGLVIATAFLGFLPWNIAKKRMFLGDVGSYLLGGGLVAVAIYACFSGISIVALAGPVLIYVADSGVTIIQRWRRGEALHEAHRSHVYQRLAAGGLGHLWSTVIVSFASVLTAGLGVVLAYGPLWGQLLSVLGILVVVGLYLALPRLLFGGRSSAGASHASPSTPSV